MIRILSDFHKLLDSMSLFSVLGTLFSVSRVEWKYRKARPGRLKNFSESKK